MVNVAKGILAVLAVIVLLYACAGCAPGVRESRSTACRCSCSCCKACAEQKGDCACGPCKCCPACPGKADDPRPNAATVK